MSAFSTEWLALREPADAAARAEPVTQAAIRALAACTPVRIVDLGSGAGSNVRYLAPRLSQAQEWLLVDNAPALLEVATRSVPVPIRTRVHDLRQLEPSLFTQRDLVTASALLDLVSESWLSILASFCQAAGAHVLFALNYDGRIICAPADETDEFVREAVNRHQRRDKGLGPALGPESGARAEALLRAAGYRVCRAQSNWVLDSAHAELQRQLIAGWAQAAAAIAPQDAAAIDAWHRRRLAHVDAGVSRLVVGHDDVAGLLR